MYILLDTFWVIWMVKYILFWLYLWQLKEYHVGRFIDHFRTHKGKKLLYDFGQIFKLVFILILLLNNNSFFTYFFPILFLIYFWQFFLVLKSLFTGGMKKPVRTAKSLLLTTISFVVAFLFLGWTLSFVDNFQVVLLLVFDLLTPILVSAVVLLFQPFFVSLRNTVLGKAEKRLREIKSFSGLTVIAITGSYGKTSTKEFLTKILSGKFRVLSTKEHQNSEVGVANRILKDLKPEHQVFIAEVGAYNKGKVKEVCSMLQPDIGMVTGVNEQHLALFGSLKNLLSAEGGGELADALSGAGTLIVNGDNAYCLDLYKKIQKPEWHIHKKIYTLRNKVVDADIWSEAITAEKDRVSFVAINKAGEMGHFEVKVLGKQNVQNMLGAILAAKELGMSFEEISEACRKISEKDGGMTLKKGKYGIDILDSSYSSNPDGVFAELDYLSIFTGKKVVVMPCLIELGKKSAEIHQEIGRSIGKVCGLMIVTTKDYFDDLRNGAKESGMDEKNIILCDSAQDAYSIVTLFCKSGDAVLLEGRVPSGLLKLLEE